MNTYTERHSGTAIVCGAAECLHDDLAKARAMRPDAMLLGCNMVPALIQDIKHAWVQDAPKVGLLIKSRIPDDVKIHTAKQVSPGMEAIYYADYVWPDLQWVCGTSGFSAALWAKHGLGFDEVILAGVPLSKTMFAYADSYPAPGNLGKDKVPAGYSEELIEHWLGHIKNHKLNGKTAGIFSMSGSTMQILGYPKE